MKNYLGELLSDAAKRFVPFKDWITELKNPEVLRADIFAGITVALVLIPQSMAYAQLAGLPPQLGLYAAFLVPIVAALFGSSRQLQNGPVAIISLMTAAALLPLNLSPEQYIAYAAMVAVMAGIMQLVLGLLRLGVMVDFLSHPVVIGFINAAAIVISSLQVSKLIGVDDIQSEHLYETIWELMKATPEGYHPATLAMGVFSLFLLLLFKKLTPQLPGILLTVIIATALAWMLDFEQLGGKVAGNIERGLPSFIMPTIDPKDITSLLMPALMIALLSFVEAFSIAKAVAAKTRQHLSANQEMVGKGLANIVAGVTQGYAVSGSFSRTAVAFEAGARTGFTAIVSGIVVGITLLFLTPLLYHLPVATLAAVIIMAVIGMIQIEPFKHVWKVSPHDGVIAGVVFISTLVFAPHLEWGIFIGVILSLIFYLHKTMRPHFAEVAQDKDRALRDAHLFGMETSEDMAIFRHDGDLYFANASYLEKRLLNAVADKPKLKVLVLDLEAVDHIDATGEEMLTHLFQRLKEAGIDFYITRAKFKLTDALKRSGLYQRIGEDHFFSKRGYVIEAIRDKYGDAVDMSHLEGYRPKT
uniref:Sulfate permease n=1 Tax=uncultured Thiotrichaceae bacterium TaxID=298394 RepID=A0A6S6SKE1_9GAMM|nr:MAG: Sulfate permease [uncultured Thiotrichaceae bacterium]